jgi:hypothetical protein
MSRIIHLTSQKGERRKKQFNLLLAQNESFEGRSLNDDANRWQAAIARRFMSVIFIHASFASIASQS